MLRRLQRGDEMLKIWNKIPEDTDILVTHSPPLGYGDLNGNNERQGCLELLNTIRFRVKPMDMFMEGMALEAMELQLSLMLPP